MPKWDFKCPRCGHVEEHSFRDVETANASKLWCPNEPWDFAPLERQPAAPSFVVKGFRAANGYSGGK